MVEGWNGGIMEWWNNGEPERLSIGRKASLFAWDIAGPLFQDSIIPILSSSSYRPEALTAPTIPQTSMDVHGLAVMGQAPVLQPTKRYMA
jgi:hypothetical protein